LKKYLEAQLNAQNCDRGVSPRTGWAPLQEAQRRAQFCAFNPQGAPEKSFCFVARFAKDPALRGIARRAEALL